MPDITVAEHRQPAARAARRTGHSLMVVVLAFVCFGVPVPAARAQGEGAASAAPAERVSVGVARLDSVWLRPEREAPAAVLARNESKLSAEVAGVVQQWTADVGARVRRGQLLAQIDPRDAELAVQRARAALEASGWRLKLAQSQLQRARDLVAQGFFSQEALSLRETEVAMAHSDVDGNRAQLATAQRQLDKTALRSPFAGSVKERLAQVGEAVAPGSVLFVLTEDAPAEVHATISPADAAGLRRAGDVRFEHAGSSHGLRLLRLAPTVSAPARTQAARLAFERPQSAPPAGSSGRVVWTETAHHLPPSLVVRRGGGLGFFVQSGSGAGARARFVPLPDAQEGRASALPEGVDAATPVVVRGHSALRDGQAIDAGTR